MILLNTGRSGPWDGSGPWLFSLGSAVSSSGSSASPCSGISISGSRKKGFFPSCIFLSPGFLARKDDAFTCRCIASPTEGTCQQGTKPAERGGRCCWFMQFGDSPEQNYLLWHRTIQKRFLAGSYSTGEIIGSTGAGDAFFAGPLGVRIVDRFRHRVQDASRVSLKWSRGVLLTIRFSAVHTGQVNRIT